MTTQEKPRSPHVVSVPTRVTAGQVQLARFRVLRDQRAGRTTPEGIERIASVVLPDDPARS